jgi:hypothetical protein
MRKEITIRFAVLAIIGLTVLIAFRSSSAREKPASRESIEGCCQKKCKTPDDNNLIWETFSRQLIFISNQVY